MTTVFGVEQVSKAFGARRVLSELSFSIEAGEVYGLVGPNGAGKTTLINITCSIVTPETGTVTLNGRPITPNAHARVGVASQEVSLYRDLTSEQNLEFFAALYGLSGDARSRRVAACLKDVGLEDRAHTLTSLLSGGMRRRLHVAAAMLHEPDLLILDEPTVGLDLESRHRIWTVVRTVAEDGRSVLVTTHQLEEAEALCHRIGVLHGGQLVAEGSMADLRRHVAAAELAIIDAEDLGAVRDRADDLGLTHRPALAALAVWLPERQSLDHVAALFSGIELRSVTLKPVGLEEVVAELTQDASRPQ
ncbi:MAG: ABC transporter ATP-binding protein [Gemmatimonadota bacterium]|nr:ABC transporter ATP-binding protein [Gemmatimonadota bacterium]